MGKTNFQSIKELSNSLIKKIDKLSNGNLNLEEIEVLTEEVRELYERIVIIRYKSYEGNNKPSIQVEDDPEIPEVVESHTQINEINPDEELMMFDFSASDNDIKENEPESNIESDLSNVEGELNSEKIAIGAENNDSSLNDNFKKTDGSMAAKFTKAAIEDLKEHIGINRKFLYINELFDGDSATYNNTLSDLNSCESAESAMKIVDRLKNTYAWSSENSTVSGFVELVERRYIS